MIRFPFFEQPHRFNKFTSTGTVIFLISYFLFLLSYFSKVCDDAKDVEAFRVGAFTDGAVADQGGTGHFRGEVIFSRIGLVTGKGIQLLLYVRLIDTHQKIREEAVAAADHVKAQHRPPAERPQRFLGQDPVILMDIGFGVDEDDIRIIFPQNADHRLQDLLTVFLKPARLKIQQLHPILRHTQRGHGGKMFPDQVPEQRIFLIIRKGYAAHIRLPGNAGDQRTAPQFDVIRMGSDEADFFSVELHAAHYFVPINPPTTLVITSSPSRLTMPSATRVMS